MSFDNANNTPLGTPARMSPVTFPPVPITDERELVEHIPTAEKGKKDKKRKHATEVQVRPKYCRLIHVKNCLCSSGVDSEGRSA
jgi:hypothetical protein